MTVIRNAAKPLGGMLLAGAAVAAIWTPTMAASPSAMPEQAAVTPAATIAPVPAGRWNVAAADQLLAAIDGARSEGLNPDDYNAALLRQARAQGAGPQLDAAANGAAMMLAHDYYFGRVSDRSDMGWMIQRSPDEAGQVQARLDTAIRAGQVKAFYDSLLPASPAYVAMREALADAPDQATRDRLRANMERWRWMPRTMAQNYLYVNVPSYRLEVVDGDTVASSYTVVVGARDTPTPQMITPTSSLVVNPWWNVPVSIIRKSNMRPGRAGFQFTSMGGGSYAVRQPPGPRNALGRIKFNLQNDQAIYLHDTPAKAGFARDERALSHGCVRVKDIDQLASELMEEGGDAGALDQALAGKGTATLRLPQTWPVYIVYFTVDRDASGTLTALSDPYGYDARIVTRLSGRPMQMASR